MAALNAAIAASRLQRAVAVKSPSPGASPKGASSPSPSSPQAKLDAMLGELRAASPARPGAAGRRHSAGIGGGGGPAAQGAGRQSRWKSISGSLGGGSPTARAKGGGEPGSVAKPEPLELEPPLLRAQARARTVDLAQDLGAARTNANTNAARQASVTLSSHGGHGAPDLVGPIPNEDAEPSAPSPSQAEAYDLLQPFVPEGSLQDQVAELRMREQDLQAALRQQRELGPAAAPRGQPAAGGAPGSPPPPGGAPGWQAELRGLWDAIADMRGQMSRAGTPASSSQPPGPPGPGALPSFAEFRASMRQQGAPAQEPAAAPAGPAGPSEEAGPAPAPAPLPAKASVVRDLMLDLSGGPSKDAAAAPWPATTAATTVARAASPSPVRPVGTHTGLGGGEPGPASGESALALRSVIGDLTRQRDALRAELEVADQKLALADEQLRKQDGRLAGLLKDLEAAKLRGAQAAARAEEAQGEKQNALRTLEKLMVERGRMEVKVATQEEALEAARLQGAALKEEMKRIVEATQVEISLASKRYEVMRRERDVAQESAMKEMASLSALQLDLDRQAAENARAQHRAQQLEEEADLIKRNLAEEQLVTASALKYAAEQRFTLATPMGQDWTEWGRSKAEEVAASAKKLRPEDTVDRYAVGRELQRAQRDLQLLRSARASAAPEPTTFALRAESALLDRLK